MDRRVVAFLVQTYTEEIALTHFYVSGIQCDVFDDFPGIARDFLHGIRVDEVEEGFLTGTVGTEDLVDWNIEEFLDSENVIPDGLCT